MHFFKKRSETNCFKRTDPALIGVPFTRPRQCVYKSTFWKYYPIFLISWYLYDFFSHDILGGGLFNRMALFYAWLELISKNEQKLVCADVSALDWN